MSSSLESPRGDRITPGLRPMTPDDLEAVHELSIALKWPHRLEDWRLMLSLGEGLVALDAEDGTVIGSILWWRYGKTAATLGMVIVAGSHQGRGVGRLLMEEAMTALAGRSVLLNATEMGLSLYRRLGFSAIGQVEQHQGVAGPVPLLALGAGVRLRPTGRSDLARFVACDSAATGMDRSRLLDALQSADAVALDREGEVIGYAICRRFGRGHVIGPVVAPDRAGAAALIAHWIGSRSGQFLRIDIPVDTGLSDWLDGIGLIRVDTVTSMALGPVPVAAHPAADGAEAPQRFALCSQALG